MIDIFHASFDSNHLRRAKGRGCMILLELLAFVSRFAVAAALSVNLHPLMCRPMTAKLQLRSYKVRGLEGGDARLWESND